MPPDAGSQRHRDHRVQVAAVRVSAGARTITVDGHTDTDPAQRTYTSDAYAAATDRYHIQSQAGAGTIRLERYQGARSPRAARPPPGRLRRVNTAPPATRATATAVNTMSRVVWSSPTGTTVFETTSAISPSTVTLAA
jgi:hypothetical protein